MKTLAAHFLILVLSGVVFLQPVSQWAVLEGPSDPMLYLDLSQGLSIRDHLHHA